MKILFATLPAQGHFNPLTGVALHLLASGHDVRWYAGPVYQPKVDALGIPSLPYRWATEITGDNLNDLYPERGHLKGPKRISFDAEKFFVANVRNHYRDIAAIRDDFPFEVAFCDAALYAAKLVAEKLEVPVFSFAVAPAPYVGVAGLPPPFFGLQPARTIAGRLRERVARTLGNSTMKRAVLRYNEVLEEEGLPAIPRDGLLRVPLQCAERVFLVGSPGLEYPQLQLPSNAEFIGPLKPAKRDPAFSSPVPDEVLDPKSTVVVVSQGTVDNDDPGKLIIPTLTALAGGPEVIVATTGGKNAQELRTRFTSPNVVITDFIDYDDLFPHADAFVTNGGFGSVLAGLRHGIPVVCAGTREGKNDDNARIGYHRLGVDLRTERPSARQIRAALQKVLADKQISGNVARIRTELEAYRPYEIIDKRLAELAARA
ncbi:glycosyltransferase [Hoyosella altamirensis]|uniref:UDP:flavonoid glycosyltransferase YjiC (YdhE family) n=1 Tax=Hoyosella altamirensis TaxID=616997 RepID=A0A839RM06_9ACTN|nr:glycosyltransferase [Hoyosella altamirensis]MBB3037116.1 UDP:flavonoid glycosyltransferase YjiC (YdhE family) [Hoyosella altamirensis]